MTHENRCSTCKHWSIHTLDLGVDWGKCKRINSAKPYKTSLGLSVAAINTGLSRAVDTTADFGCALWEERE